MSFPPFREDFHDFAWAAHGSGQGTKRQPSVLVQYVRYTSMPMEARYSAGVRWPKGLVGPDRVVHGLPGAQSDLEVREVGLDVGHLVELLGESVCLVPPR